VVKSENVAPWAVFVALSTLHRSVVIDEIDRGLIEVLPLTHIGGRSLHDSFCHH
jgi:predicted ribonuclease YlaK